jgi:hypothetical protein
MGITKQQMLVRIWGWGYSPLNITDENVNKSILYGNQCRGPSKKLKIPFDQATPLLDVYLKESKSMYNIHLHLSLWQYYSQQLNK